MRLYIATAAGLDAERQAVERAAERLAVRLGSDGAPEIVDWSRHLAEHGSGYPPITDSDFFLGLAWLSFAGAGDPAPASQEDFELARQSWQASTSGAPRSLIYRCRRLPQSLADINGVELARVDEFFVRLQEDAEGWTRVHEYQSTPELEIRLEADLYQLIKGSKVAVVSAQRPAEPEAPKTGFAAKMEAGKAYEVSFLSLEILHYDELAGQGPLDKLETAARSFERLVVETASGYGGELFTWSRSGGLVIFWSRRSFDHAIITGLKVIHSLPVFNVDPQQNPLGTTLEVRAAAHDAVIVFQPRIESITSPDIDFVQALRGESTQSGELTVSKRLLDRADERLKPRFKLKGRFQSEPILACKLPSTQQHTLRANLDELHQAVGQRIAAIRRILGLSPADIDAPAVETFSAAVDEAYSLLNDACNVLGGLDRSWSKKFFADLVGVVSNLVKQETALWKALRASLEQYREAPAVMPRLEAIVKAASARRSRPAVTLAKAEHGLKGLAQVDSGKAPPAAAPAQVAEELIKKLRALERADPLDQETVLTDLLLSDKTALLEFLTTQTAHAQHEPTVDKLWESADLLLIDDLYSIRGHRRAGDRKITEVLVSEPVSDGRFRVVRQLLAEKVEPGENQVRELFARHEIEPETRDLQTVWRCLVLGHPVIEIRTRAAFKMSQFSMWQAISQPNIPIASIHAIGERVAKAESEDAKKIFFDCTRAPVAAAVESFRTREELEAITKLILLLLDFPFLVETGYFERFDAILGGFLEHAQKVGLKVDYFENLRQRLDQARQEPDHKKSSKPPAGISKLPLTLQRRLAAEPEYVFWFVTHPDPRIAGETLRHVSLGNVERVLRMPEINNVVMSSLLRKPELFTRSGPLLAALNNPKCEQNFAGRHMPSLARTPSGLPAIEKLARNPSANPGVRAAARQILTQQKRVRA